MQSQGEIDRGQFRYNHRSDLASGGAELRLQLLTYVKDTPRLSSNPLKTPSHCTSTYPQSQSQPWFTALSVTLSHCTTPLSLWSGVEPSSCSLRCLLATGRPARAASWRVAAGRNRFIRRLYSVQQPGAGDERGGKLALSRGFCAASLVHGISSFLDHLYLREG